MNHIKSFNEMRKSNIHTGIELTPRQINYIFDGIDNKEYLEEFYNFKILVDDGIFYVKCFNEKWEFDRIQDLRDFIHLRYYMNKHKPNEILEIFKRNKNLDYSFGNNWPIRWSSVNGYLEIAKILLQDPKVDPSYKNNYAIRYASRNGHIEIVKLLLQDDRVDPSDVNNLAIRWASQNGHLEIVKLLLQDDRVDPSADDNYAIKSTSELGHTEVIKLLIQHPKVRSSLTEKEIEEYESY